MALRVLTYNMHKGFCFYSRQYVIGELREAIRAVNADIVFLQEVMGIHPVKNSEAEVGSQFEFLADELWPHFAYGKNAVYSAGHHGNAILSKFPIVAYENLNVSTNKLEQRGLLHAQVDWRNGETKPLHLVCLHLDLLARGRKQQLERLTRRVQSHVPEDVPLIVAGDFNDWNEKLTDPLQEGLGLVECGQSFLGEHARTFPSWKPFLPLDRMYTRRFEVSDFKVLAGEPWRRLSDHAAVVAELELVVAPAGAKIG